MTYPPFEPPPADPPLPPQQPYVPGQNLPGYSAPPGAASETHAAGTPTGAAPETYAYGPAATPGPEAYGYGTPPVPGTNPYGYGTGATPGPYGYGMPQYYYPAYPYGYAAPQPTEGLAIASLVVSCAAVLGLCTWGLGGVLGIVGAILGHVARRRIRLNGRNGDGMALAGIIVGWILATVSVALVILFVVLITHDTSSTENI